LEEPREEVSGDRTRLVLVHMTIVIVLFMELRLALVREEITVKVIPQDLGLTTP
jgi:hypothetical protein